jgi:hypothetical protein
MLRSWSRILAPRVWFTAKTRSRHLAIGSIGRLCDLSQFDTLLDYAFFLCRVVAVCYNTLLVT